MGFAMRLGSGILAKQAGTSRSALLGRTASSRSMLRYIPLHTLHKPTVRRYSASTSDPFYKYLIAEIQQGHILSPAAPGYTWVTPDTELQQIVARHFPKVFESTHSFSGLQAAQHTRVNVIPPHKIPQTAKHHPEVDSVAVGGPSAQLFTYMATQIHRRNTSIATQPPLYVIDDIGLANWPFSARQLHPRYAYRMSHALEYSGLNMLRHALIRMLRSPELQDTQRANYYCIDFSLYQLLQKDLLSLLSICLSNELTTWIDAIQGLLRLPTTATQTIAFAQSSLKIISAIDDELGGKLLQQDGALNIALSAKDNAALDARHRILRRYNVDSQPITSRQLSERYGLNVNIESGFGGAYYFPNEGCLAFDAYQQLNTAIRHNAGTVYAGRTLTDIVVSNDKVDGVVLQDQNGQQDFIPSRHGVYASLGCRAQYQLDPELRYSSWHNSAFLQGFDPSTTATGLTSIGILEGKLPLPIAGTPHHWTPIAEEGPYTLVTGTGGAAIGTYDQYNFHQAAHHNWLSQRILGRTYRILAAGGCTRAIGSQNTEKMTPLTSRGGLLHSNAGGKGITGAAASAAVAIKELYPGRYQKLAYANQIDLIPRFGLFRPPVKLKSQPTSVVNIDAHHSNKKTTKR